MSASARASTSSNTFDRWLTSRIDMPTPGSATSSLFACSSTGTGSTAGPAEKLKMRSDFMNQQSISKFGLEPCRLRRHDFTRVRHIHQVDEADGIHRKRDGHPAAVDELLERVCAFRTSDKIDSFVGAHVLNAQNRCQQSRLEDVAVERVDDADAGCARACEIDRVPLARDVHRHFPFFSGSCRS